MKYKHVCTLNIEILYLKYKFFIHVVINNKKKRKQETSGWLQKKKRALIRVNNKMLDEYEYQQKYILT
jgi:hypothetical protein